jgi:hypothetical protein
MVRTMLGKQSYNEGIFEAKAGELARGQQEQAFTKTMEDNDEAKNELLAKYKNRLADGNLSPEERAQILAEMEGKMAMINDLINNEEQA